MIHVFGSVNLDLVVPVARLPREGETVLGPGYRALPGGKGANQALAAARAGAGVSFSACVGTDSFAETALAELRAGGVDLRDVRRVREPTGCAFITVDEDGRNQIVVAAGANAMLRADRAALSCLARAGTLLLQLEVPARENFAMAAAAAANSCRVVLNVAPAAPLAGDVLRGVDWLLLNEGEACVVAAGAGLAATDARTAAVALAAHTGHGVVVTLGAAGALMVAGAEQVRQPVHAIRVLDTTGAGDAFAGCFAAALDAGSSATVALTRATVAGSLACTVAGAQAGLPSAAAIDAALAASR